jgi:SAM-dependent methyltransferase
MNRILDWGRGRVIAQLLKLIPPRHLFGCDIDAEAIAWNIANLHGPEFTRINPYPPTPYPDRFFDLIYGISVMTHLDEKTQMLWLAELRRIANRGGILVLSVIGEALRSENMSTARASEFARKGFVSIVPNYSDLLSEHSHQNYYQEAYHSFDYIASHRVQHFDVLEFVITKHQDLVILQAK